MAQEQVVNNEGVVELIKFMAGVAASGIHSISCVKTACSAATASGSANYTRSAASGLTLATIATITASQDQFASDTVHIEHPFTAGAVETVKGHVIMNSEDDALYSVCCYAGDITVESGDTITVTHKIRGKNG